MRVVDYTVKNNSTISRSESLTTRYSVFMMLIGVTGAKKHRKKTVEFGRVVYTKLFY